MVVVSRPSDPATGGPGIGTGGVVVIASGLVVKKIRAWRLPLVIGSCQAASQRGVGHVMAATALILMPGDSLRVKEK